MNLRLKCNSCNSQQHLDDINPQIFTCNFSMPMTALFCVTCTLKISIAVRGHRTTIKVYLNVTSFPFVPNERPIYFPYYSSHSFITDIHSLVHSDWMRFSCHWSSIQSCMKQSIDLEPERNPGFCDIDAAVLFCKVTILWTLSQNPLRYFQDGLKWLLVLSRAD